MYVTRKPILSAGMNWLRATSRKYRLKKNLNCSYSTSGRNVTKLYFWLRTTLAGYVCRRLSRSSNAIVRVLYIPDAALRRQNGRHARD